jgi:hypothetical protein
MRKGDKLKNIEQVNLMIEQCYLKSKGLLDEGKRLKVSDDLKKQIIEIVDVILPKKIEELGLTSFERVFGDDKSKKGPLFLKKVLYTELDLKSISKIRRDKDRNIVNNPISTSISTTVLGSGKNITKLKDEYQSECSVYLVSDYTRPANGWYITNKPENRKDNEIYLNVRFSNEDNNKKNGTNYFSSHLSSGARDFFYDVLLHEFVHAIDTKSNKNFDKQEALEYGKKFHDYNQYYSTPQEFLAESTRFFERIIKEAEKIKLRDKEWETFKLAPGYIEALEIYLRFVQRGTYSGKISQPSDDDGSKYKKEYLKAILTSLFRVFGHEISDSGEVRSYGDKLEGLTVALKIYHDNNPELYKKFVTKLYNTVQEVKDILKTEEQEKKELNLHKKNRGNYYLNISHEKKR